MARYRFPDSEIYVFARSTEERAFTMKLGVAWVGEISGRLPSPTSLIAGIQAMAGGANRLPLMGCIV